MKRILGNNFSGYPFAIGAGFLLTAAFPNIGIAGCAWVAPTLMIAVASGKRGGDAFRVGYIAGLAHFLSSLYWLLLIPVTGYPILGWVVLSAYLALYPATWVWLTIKCVAGSVKHESWAGRMLWSLSGAAIWVALEMVRARLFGGFPWNPLGASQYQLVPLIQIASVTGVYGVSFLVVWVSLSLFSAGRMIFRRPTLRMAWLGEIILPLAVIVVLFGFGFARINGQNPPGTALRITLVQPSIPQTLIWNSNEDAKRFQQLLQLSQQALDSTDVTNHEPLLEAPASRRPVGSQNTELAGETPALPGIAQGRARDSQTDLLIWPESAVPSLSETNYIAITNLIRTHRVWLIFNAEDSVWRPEPKNRNDFDVFNAAYLFNPEGRFMAVYHKQKLVIFGEYVPLIRWLPFLKWFTPITDSFASGTTAVPFEMDGWSEHSRKPFGQNNDISPSGSPGVSPRQKVKTSALICFEDVFPQLARESVQDDTDFLVNLTNDGWFGDSAEQWQHAANSVFRAVENNVPLVRCCNNGVSCWVNASGRLREIVKDQSGSVYGIGARTIEIPLHEHAPTFYNRHGDWFGWGCVSLLGLMLGARIYEQRRNPASNN